MIRWWRSALNDFVNGGFGESGGTTEERSQRGRNGDIRKTNQRNSVSSPLTPFLRCISAAPVNSVRRELVYLGPNSTFTSGCTSIDSPVVVFSFSRASGGRRPSMAVPNIAKSALLDIIWLKSTARIMTFEPET